MQKQILLSFLLFFVTTGIRSQSCDVIVDSLKGQYIGDCKKGMADGKGTAMGINSYTGDFKNGYPHGYGKYTWQNGNCYEGFWKSGLFEGQGTFKQINQSDSFVLTGFWKKGTYISRYEKPYIVHTPTNNISNINVRKINAIVPEIVFTVKNITGGASNIQNPVLPKSRLIDMQIIQGRFEQQITDETSSNITNKYTLRKVTFPFYAIFSFHTTGTTLQVEKVGIEILEDGNWYLQFNIDN